jgi:hypothetical protein
MKYYVYQMETPGAKSKEMIIEHINDVHERSIIVRNDRILYKTPDTLGKYFRKVSYICNPSII